MPDRRLIAALIVAAAGVLSGTVARAEPVEDELRRLDDLAYFVRTLDRGWDPLVTELQTSLDRLRADAGSAEVDLSPVVALRDEVVWTRADALFGLGREADEPRCLELYRLLAASAGTTERRDASRRKLADLSIRRGERFEQGGDEAAALAAYLEAVDQAPEYEPGYEKVGKLGVSQADRKVEAQEYDAALQTLDEVLERIERGLKPSNPRIAEVRTRRQTILDTTGTLQVRFLGDAARLAAVRGDGTDFRNSEIRLSPSDRGPTPPVVSAAAPRRVRTGTYDAVASVAGGERSIPATVTVRPDPDGGSITLPVIIPEGMVWVPAAAGAPSFLCDRTEVSVEAYNEFARASGLSPLPFEDGYPARDVPLANAKRFAGEWMRGKSLPTLAQWTHAAFGAPFATSPPYPWGTATPVPGRHFFDKSTGIGRVDECAEGASLCCGALNMAGNVMEWLNDGWLIGGGYSGFRERASYQRPVDGQTSWEADALRDAVPTPAVWDGLTPEQKNKHYSYRISEELWNAGFLRAVGFRCVINLE